MSYKETINNLKPLEYKDYFEKLSYETFMLYTASFLEEKWIPITYSYLCIATYKLFPDMFPFDKEFKEYPDWEKLNRTYMHLRYPSNKKLPPCISWTKWTIFKFTEYWKEKAKIAKAKIGLTKITWDIKKKDDDKQGRWRYDEFLQKCEWLKEYEETWKFDEMSIYSFFEVTPFTHKTIIRESLTMWKGFAEEDNNTRCVEYIKRFLATL